MKIDKEELGYLIVDMAGIEGYLLSQIHHYGDGPNDGYNSLTCFVRAARKVLAALRNEQMDTTKGDNRMSTLSKGMSENWRSVEDHELPEDGSEVIVYAEQQNASGGFVKLGVWDVDDGWLQVGNKIVTYWMPLPEAPDFLHQNTKTNE